MPKPAEYKHIRAWGKMLQSMDYYIKGEQRKAAADNAPLDAVYFGDGRWHTASELSPQARTEIELLIK